MNLEELIQLEDDYMCHLRDAYARYMYERRYGVWENKLVSIYEYFDVKILNKIILGNISKPLSTAIALPCWITEAQFNMILSSLKTTMRNDQQR